MPKLSAVLESALYVDDLSRAKEFYEGSLGLPRLLALSKADLVTPSTNAEKKILSQIGATRLGIRFQ